MLSKIFYISFSFSLIIIITLLYNNDNSSKPIIKISNDELEKLKELDDLIYHITIIYNYLEKNKKYNKKYNEIINLIEKSNIEIEIINKEIERLKSEL
jgi:hypothetical protein